jgi:hypothetical protein
MDLFFIEGIAAFLMYLIGGALVLFIYEAYAKTKQKNLMFMAVGFFVIIFGSNLNTLAAGMNMTPQYYDMIDIPLARLAALIIQLAGIIILLYSATNPFDRGN